MPEITKVITTVLHKPPSEILSSIQLTNDTVKRCTVVMENDMEELIITLSDVRWVNNEIFHEELLLAKYKIIGKNIGGELHMSMQ